MYSPDKIDESNSVECQNCAMRFSTQIGPDGLSAVPKSDTDAIAPSLPFLGTSVEGIKIECPNCGSKYIYKDEHRLKDGRVNCQNCSSVIDAIGEDVLIVKEPIPAETQSENFVLCLIIIIVLLFVPLIIAIPIFVCIAVWKALQSRDSFDYDSKVISRDTQGPDPW
ncbi:MAG: MJ0042-type zinc finger domain-containing protein [Candidatus Thorarchaeota archaeon]